MKQIRDVIVLFTDGVPDRSGDFFDKTSVIKCDNSEVPLVDSTGQEIGRAIPLIDKTGALLDLRVDLQFFDWSLISESMKHFKPCFNGACITRMVSHILEAKLTSVSISADNSDPRIPTIASYIGLAPLTPVAATPKPGVCECVRLLNGHEPTCGWINGKN